jgi:2-dehydro-3-deoxyphosphogluconate aldolase/(4S)-4-hydroxy-2-oxoglutarate aldolase
MQGAWLELLRQERAIAVIRAEVLEIGQMMGQAVAVGGMRLIEVTWNSSDPVDLVKALKHSLPNCVIGAGTLQTVADVQEAIAAGAEFLFTPHTAPALIQAAVELQVPMVAGALSPTEIMTAWQAGATCVKVFPIKAVGGVSYLECIKEPLGNIPLIPTGGITISNAADFVRAGAIAVGLAGQLFPKEAIAAGDWGMVTERAIALRSNLQV